MPKSAHQAVAHSTAFAGISGSTTRQTEALRPAVASPQPAKPPEKGGVLHGPENRWAISLTTLTPAQGQLLLTVLHDLSPLSVQTDTTLTLRIAAYDEAATRDSALAQEIHDGLAALDALARRVTMRSYAEIAGRSLRRPLLLQLAHLPLLQRLGVGHSAYAAAVA